MKKLFIVLAVASLGFVACNNEAENQTKTEDSLANKVDSTADATKDSLQSNTDSLKSNIDSTASAVKDSLKK